MSSASGPLGYGHIVIGPPGSGKSTYCNGVAQFLVAAGRASVHVVNLDPANENPPYEPAVDVRDLVDVAAVMETHNLGPNGALLYCMEYLFENKDWLEAQLRDVLRRAGAGGGGGGRGGYFLFDCPGQVELYTQGRAIRGLVDTMTRTWGLSLAAVNLVDSLHCTDASRFISVALMSLSTMLQLELPHVNVLSKIDLVENAEGDLPLDLDVFTEMADIGEILAVLNDGEGSARFRRLNAALCELVDDFGLVSYHVLNIQSKESVARVIAAADSANGFAYGTLSAMAGATPTMGMVGAIPSIPGPGNR
jgi:GTPase SAR1 family protein